MSLTGFDFALGEHGSFASALGARCWWARHGAAMCLVAFEAWQHTFPAKDDEQVRALQARMARAGGVEPLIAQLPPDDREEILVVSGVTPRRLWVRTRRITRPRTGSAHLGPVDEGNPATVAIKAFANLPWGTEPLPANFPLSGPCPHCGGSPHDD